MIDNVDDILRIAREISKTKANEEKTIISLIHRNDNLTDLRCELINAGYNPGINFEAGRPKSLNMKFKFSTNFLLVSFKLFLKSDFWTNKITNLSFSTWAENKQVSILRSSIRVIGLGIKLSKQKI